MAWKPAPNLARRVAMVHAVWPTMVVGEIGDPAHKAEHSDHNADSRGVEHAIDIMTETDTANDGAAAIILAWLLADTTDLQYVIHDRVIYGRDEANGWHGAPYTGSDPHTNHIHVSGKHGSTGKNAATGTGYDLAAEAYTPPVTLLEFMEATMPTAEEIAAAVWTYKPSPTWPGLLVETPLGMLNDTTKRVSAVTGVQLPALSGALAGLTASAIASAIQKLWPSGPPAGESAQQIADALHAELVADAQKTAAALAAPTP